KARGVPLMYYFHQGGHGGAPPMELMNRWFTRYLYGIENGVENAPRAWIVREGHDRPQPTPYPDYPHPPQAPVTRPLGAAATGAPLMYSFPPGGHGGAPAMELMNRWFTRYLDGIENGVEDAPRGWIVREGHDRLQPTPYPDYPHPDAAPVTLQLRAAAPGADGLNGIGELVPSATPGQGTESLVDDDSFSGAELAAAERSGHRLLSATPVLTVPVHISGTPRVTIRLASSKPAANLSVWLVALPWEGGLNITDDVITRGWADPQNRESIRESEPLVPGRFYELTFDLQPDDQVIPAGQRIALMIFSSDRDFTLWPEPGTVLTVDLSGTRLELPVVG